MNVFENSALSIWRR